MSDKWLNIGHKHVRNLVTKALVNLLSTGQATCNEQPLTHPKYSHKNTLIICIVHFGSVMYYTSRISVDKHSNTHARTRTRTRTHTHTHTHTRVVDKQLPRENELPTQGL